MKTASYTLIPFTAFGTETGNYDGQSESFIGTPQKAATYYLKEKELQTIAWYLNEFAGGIIIEATLDTDPETENYFQISPEPIGNIPEVEIMIYPPPVYPPITENKAINIVGNYTWIRARVFRFTSGTINKVSMGY